MGENICNLTFANPMSNEILLVSRITHRALTALQWKANDTVNQWVWHLNAQLHIKMCVVSKLMLRGVTVLEGGLAVPQSAEPVTSPRRGRSVETESWTSGCQALGLGGVGGDQCQVWGSSVVGVMGISTVRRW